MFKEQSDESQLDDAFDDTCISTPVSSQARGKSYSLADTPKSPQFRLDLRSFSTPFTAISLTDSPSLQRRFSSSSSTPSFRVSSLGSLSSLGPSSTPSSTPEFIIPKRTAPPRPPTLTSQAEILSQIEGNQLKGYHSLILREKRGQLSSDDGFERPMCGNIPKFDFTFSTNGLQMQRHDSFSDFQF